MFTDLTDVRARRARARGHAPRGTILGLYTGGTLAHEAGLVVEPLVGAADGRTLVAVASVVGTGGDPQDLRRQITTLEAAGVEVLPSNAQAARFAAELEAAGATVLHVD